MNIHRLDLLNLIPCELDLTFSTFCDTKMITYEIKIPHSGKKVGFNLLDDEYFTIPYITDKIPNLPTGNQITEQAKMKCVYHIYQWVRSHLSLRRV